mmetsp:Transcript_16065/g.41061  ORF Transcript_16065/g.41061 Transcript_16065/m.41061 type:complete len:202 (+) Transcript_16065:553-1158(+)
MLSCRGQHKFALVPHLELQDVAAVGRLGLDKQRDLCRYASQAQHLVQPSLATRRDHVHAAVVLDHMTPGHKITSSLSATVQRDDKLDVLRDRGEHVSRHSEEAALPDLLCHGEQDLHGGAWDETAHDLFNDCQDHHDAGFTVESYRSPEAELVSEDVVLDPGHSLTVEVAFFAVQMRHQQQWVLGLSHRVRGVRVLEPQSP